MGKKLFVQIFYLHIMIYTRHKPYSCLVVWWLISLCIVYENINTWLSHKKILWTYFSIVFIFIFSTLHTTYLPIFDVLLLYQSEKIIPGLFLPFFCLLWQNQRPPHISIIMLCCDYNMPAPFLVLLVNADDQFHSFKLDTYIIYTMS